MVRGDLCRSAPRARAAIVLVALLAVAVVSGCGTAGPEAAEGAGPACGEVVLGDWADGSIDGVYEADCYFAAIDSLPEDVRMYTSAEDDITRAMQGAAAAGASSQAAGSATERRLSAAQPDAAEPKSSASLRSPPLPLLLLAGFALVLLAGGLAATATRRIRRNG